MAQNTYSDMAREKFFIYYLIKTYIFLKLKLCLFTGYSVLLPIVTCKFLDSVFVGLFNRNDGLFVTFSWWSFTVRKACSLHRYRTLSPIFNWTVDFLPLHLFFQYILIQCFLIKFGDLFHIYFPIKLWSHYVYVSGCIEFNWNFRVISLFFSPQFLKDAIYLFFNLILSITPKISCSNSVNPSITGVFFFLVLNWILLNSSMLLTYLDKKNSVRNLFSQFSGIRVTSINVCQGK